MAFPTKILSHRERVCALYKEALRHTQSWYPERHEYRYHAVLLRHRFDQTKVVIDQRKSMQMVLDGEKELWEKQHPMRIRFQNSPGGVAFERDTAKQCPDWVMDMWHPYEKAVLPEYFARREIRKKEYIERWEKKYGEKTGL